MNSRYQRNRVTERSLLADSRNVSSAESRKVSAASEVKQNRELQNVQIAVPDITKSPVLREQSTHDKESVGHNGETAVKAAVNGQTSPTAGRNSNCL